MPFGYETRTQQYIDTTRVEPKDRIKVIFENRQIIYLLLPESQIVHKRSSSVRLHVDKVRTQERVLSPLYQHAVDEARKFGRRKNRHHFTLENARTHIDIVVFIRKQNDAFDDSPCVGKSLRVLALFPSNSGSAYRFPSPIKSVEFITI